MLNTMFLSPLHHNTTIKIDIVDFDILDFYLTFNL